MNIYLIRHFAEDVTRTKEKGHAEAQPTGKASECDFTTGALEWRARGAA